MRTKVCVIGFALLLASLFAGDGRVRSARAEPENLGPAVLQEPGASLGTAFTYQGRLQDGGQPADGSYDFRFILYDAGTGGSQVGPTLGKGDVAVSQGIFTAVLDFGNVFNGQALWLEVAVRPGDSTGSYTTLSPRQALTAAPYAAYSQRVNAASHNHLGQTWTGSDNPLEITGSFGAPDNAPLVLSNTSGDGLHVNSASGRGVYVDSASQDGVHVRSAGSPSNHVSSAGKNGFEVAGAEGYGLFVGRADLTGVDVYSAGQNGVYARTTQADNNYGIYTPDNIYAANFSGTSYTLIAQVAGSGSLSPGDLAAATGLGEPLPDSSDPLPLVQLADATSGSVAGVVQGRMVLVPHPQPEGESSEPLLELRSAEGPAGPGDYVALRVMGPARVRVDASTGAIQPGQRLTVSSLGGAARALQTRTLDGMAVSEGAPVIGTALSGPDENGMLWVLVNPQ